jgi:hypothetical protein
VTGHRIGRRPDQPDRLHDPARDHALLIALARRLRDAGIGPMIRRAITRS